MANYVWVDGVLVEQNDEVNLPTGSGAGVSKQSSLKALFATISSMKDFQRAAEIQKAATGTNLAPSKSTMDAMQRIQDEKNIEKYGVNTKPQGKYLLDQIGERFSKHRIPLGMLSKLLTLAERKLDVLVDDSGSMDFGKSDVDIVDVTYYLDELKAAFFDANGRMPGKDDKMTRWQEAEEELHQMIEMIAYLPFEYMQIRFLNKDDVLVLDRKARKYDTLEAFEADAHARIHERFKTQPEGRTFTYKKLKQGFDMPGSWSHYFLNDGQPNDLDEVIELIWNRNHPEKHALTLRSCTDNLVATAWMKSADLAPFVAEIDDEKTEREEVRYNQGAEFPYSTGMYRLCALAASTNPDDLDALDESVPFTRHTLSEMEGRRWSELEYRRFFENNPNAFLYVKEYVQFLNEEKAAAEIVNVEAQRTREVQAGYLNGKRPKSMPLQDISKALDAVIATHESAKSSQKAADVVPIVIAEVVEVLPSIPEGKQTSVHGMFQPPKAPQGAAAEEPTSGLKF